MSSSWACDQRFLKVSLKYFHKVLSVTERQTTAGRHVASSVKVWQLSRSTPHDHSNRCYDNHNNYYHNSPSPVCFCWYFGGQHSGCSGLSPRYSHRPKNSGLEWSDWFARLNITDLIWSLTKTTWHREHVQYQGDLKDISLRNKCTLLGRTTPS